MWVMVVVVVVAYSSWRGRAGICSIVGRCHGRAVHAEVA